MASLLKYKIVAIIHTVSTQEDGMTQIAQEVLIKSKITNFLVHT